MQSLIIVSQLAQIYISLMLDLLVIIGNQNFFPSMEDVIESPLTMRDDTYLCLNHIA